MRSCYAALSLRGSIAKRMTEIGPIAGGGRCWLAVGRAGCRQRRGEGPVMAPLRTIRRGPDGPRRIEMICALSDPRASALLSVEPRALPPLPSILSATRPTPERLPKPDRGSVSEAGERGAKRTASDAPAHSPAADVGVLPTGHRNSLGSRAGSPTRATCCKAKFLPSSPP
jgi:hypothetical protein